MFYTERLMLRALDVEADSLTFLRWNNDADYMWSLNLQAPQPNTRTDAKKFCEALTTRDSGLPVFVICEKPGQTPDRLTGNDDMFLLDGKPRYPCIGILNFYTSRKAVSVSNQTASFGIAFDNEHQGRGLGTEVLTWAMGYAFDTLNLHRMKLTVAAGNEGARRCYRKVGFKEEGCLREDYWKNGKWEDIIIMGFLRNEWVEKRL